MLEAVRDWLAPGYLYIKAVHLFAVMAWIWSAAAAFAYILVPVFKAWRRNPTDPEVIELRNWAIERWDQIVDYEHIAFPVVLVSGPLLYWVAGWNTASAWLALKLLIVVGIFLPIEIIDYYVSYFGGNKRRLRLRGDRLAFERTVQWHWLFLLLTAPIIMVFGTLVVFLAVVKPL